MNPEPCPLHAPPYDAIEAPDKSRPGWIESTCRRCGKLLGYRPQDIAPAKGPELKTAKGKSVKPPTVFDTYGD